MEGAEWAGCRGRLVLRDGPAVGEKDVGKRSTGALRLSSETFITCKAKLTHDRKEDATRCEPKVVKASGTGQKGGGGTFQAPWNVLDGKECSRMFRNVLGKGWVAWNKKLGTEIVMSSGEGGMAFSEMGVSWRGMGRQAPTLA